MEYAMVNATASPDVRIVGPHFNASSHSPSVPGYIQKIDPGFLLLSNYLLLSPDLFLLLPFILSPPPRHDWDVECYLHFDVSIVGLVRPWFSLLLLFFF
jgi:hypothetical protein